MSSPSVLEQFVHRARSLYSLPAVALKVLDLTQQPKVDVRALKACIENDPALTTRILRVVNSSLFGLTREVTDLNQALALLGIKPLKMLVLGFSLPKDLFAALEADVLARYWRHTLTKAVVAREIAQRYWRTGGDDAFIAGLLQEIGELALIQDLGEPYVRFAQRVLSNGGDLLALEIETLGFDHAILSARLLDHWGLPESIVRAVGAPHDAARIQQLPPADRLLPQVLHVAELIARLLTSEKPGPLDELSATCRVYGRMTLDDLPELLATLAEKIEQLADVLNLQLTGGGDYRDVLADAHRQLASVAGDAAADMLGPASWHETVELSQALAQWSPAAGGESLPRTSTPGGDSHPRSTPRAAPAPVATSTLSAPWHDPGVTGRLGVVIASCRQQRTPVSLMLAEVDRFDEWIMTLGKEPALALMRRLEAALAARLDPGSHCLALGDGKFTLLLSGYDRQAGVALGRELNLAAKELYSGDGVLSLSLGVASMNVPPKNFPPRDMVAAANRCLTAAQLSGGDSLKSIELM